MRRSVKFMDARLPLRFWDKIAPEPNTGCWLWTGTGTANGYPQFGMPKGDRACVIQLAHRISYQYLVGPIPDGFHIDHLCRTRCCVNPAHLEAVTPRTNALRGTGPTAVNAAKTHCPKGHRYDRVDMHKDGPARRCSRCRKKQEQKRHRRTKAGGDSHGETAQG